MFKKFFFYLVMLFLPLVLQAKIIETSHIADVMPYLDQDTWFLVDLDNTMFQAKQALGHANWFYDEVAQRMEKGMSREEAIREFYPTWLKAQETCGVQCLEEDFIPSLLRAQDLGLTVMGLTHRQPLVAHLTIRQIESLGFDFMRTAPSQESFEISAANPAIYLQGVLFVSDYNNKGEIFLSFLSIIEQKPKRIVFIDDKRKNVEELERALSSHGIEYIGVHYTAIENVEPVYLREIAQFQYKFINQIMSNEAAFLLVKHGVE